MVIFSAACIVLVLHTIIEDVSARAPTKIIGGTDTTIEEFPSIVSIRDEAGDHICGGTLISNKHVMTAAHCLVTMEKKRHKVTKFVNKVTVCVGGCRKNLEEPREVKRTDIHELFDGDYSETSYILHDIGIITLKEAIEESPTRRPIALPSENTPIGETGYVAGWGSVDKSLIEIPLTLQKARMNIIACKIIPGTMKIPDTEICAFNRKDIGFCVYDSGSPLIVNNEVVGIASWKWTPSCAEGYPDVYTRVESYVEWIRNIISPHQPIKEDELR
ncbi:chymotrypsin-2-like [Fopius arisanus]|uniref:Chymotrypsin-2-like n=1 Tax=Fopius arisanus TaxID=64838 RepID=A0A9R1SZQ0_9HYME|nr:PREDICTED: chymotrypsin-2-like [Fopius arisanus]